MNGAGPDRQRQGSAAPIGPDICGRCGLSEEQHVIIEGTGPEPWCPDMPEAQAASAARAKAMNGTSTAQHEPEPPTDEAAQIDADEFERQIHIDATALRMKWEAEDPRDNPALIPGAQDEPPPHTEIPPGVDGEPILDVPSASHGGPPKIEIATLPPLTLDEWRGRDLPEPDFIMGHWLTTTSRVLLTAATGLGKTNFGLALGMRVAAGEDFLHWRAHRPCRVLYIDGEMSRRLLRQRVLDEEKRLGITPEFFFALSHEDIEGFRPLNTIEGQAWMNALIEKLGGVDLVTVDNIMSLTVGDMKDPEPWQHTIPWAHSLTKRAIGQIWIHHTGHDESRSYGDKSREWQMDTVAHLDAVKRDDTDVSFSMAFKKARERTPATRLDFQDVKIALVNDCWEHELTTPSQRAGRVPPMIEKALNALMNVIGSDQAVTLPGNRRASHRDHWQAECALLGLIDQSKIHSARTLFNKFRRELVAANRIACEGDFSWLIH